GAFIRAKLAGLLPVAACAVYVCEQPTGVFRCHVALGSAGAELHRRTATTVDGLIMDASGGAGPPPRTRATVDGLIMDASGGVDHPPGRALRSVLVAPLAHGTETLGALVVSH